MYFFFFLKFVFKSSVFSSVSPGGAGVGLGEAVLGATLCGVD